MPTFIQPSFAKGELAPQLHGRVDTAAYQVGLAKARNCIIHAYGGVSNRAGLMFVAPVKDHSYTPRLIKFQFKTSDQYLLEFGDQYMRVIRNDGHVLEAPKTITGATAANPVVVTAVAHGYSAGHQVFIQNVGGMTRLNGRWFVVANPAANTFELVDQLSGDPVNGTGFAAYTSGGTVARVYEIATPYAVADLPNLKHEQSADVMTFAHNLYPVQELRRTAHDNWAMTAPTFQPLIGHPTGISAVSNSGSGTTYSYKVTAIAAETGEESLPGLSSTTQTITNITQAAQAVVTTSGAHGYSVGTEVYIAAVVGMTEVNGRRFTIIATPSGTTFTVDEDTTGYTAYSSGGTANATHVEVSGGTTPNNTISWSAIPAGSVKCSVYRAVNGVYGFVGDANGTSFTDNNIAPDLDIGPPAARNPFLFPGQYPGAVGYYEQRRVFGGSLDKPDTSEYSQIGNQSNHSKSSPLKDSDAITATLASREVNEIRHYVGGKDLIILTSGAEWGVNSGQDSAFSAVSIKQKPQSSWGSSHRRPIQAGNTVLFVEENNSRVRSLGYSLQIDGYTGTDMNYLAGHMFESYMIRDWAYASTPDPIVHVVREDGRVACLTFQQEQEVIGWSTWDTPGKFEASCTLRHDEDDADDKVYFVVRRVVNGNVVRYIERTHSRRFTDIRDAFFVDSGLTYDDPIAITDIDASTTTVVVTAPSHGLSNGTEVDFSDIEWEPEIDEFDAETQPDQLNFEVFTIANATANTFEVTVPSVAGWKGYVEGGYVRRRIQIVTGLDHLEGRSVAALTNGNVVSDMVVTNGAITLPRAAGRIHIGLRYTADIETLAIEAPQGTVQGKRKKIAAVVGRFFRTRGLFYGTDPLALSEMKQREDEDWGQPTDMLTGDKHLTTMGQWDRVAKLYLRQRYPLPLTLLALVPEIALGDVSERGE